MARDTQATGAMLITMSLVTELREAGLLTEAMVASAKERALELARIATPQAEADEREEIENWIHMAFAEWDEPVAQMA